ncbi:uncharacterized protein LOC115563068 [Drosophila navojoa]|nr:uncharacterized protein LOC115563068 [Drosophila navojoa]
METLNTNQFCVQQTEQRIISEEIGSKMESLFTDEMTDFIIDSVRAAEYLWNPANPLYKLRHLKNDFWQKLTDDINIKFSPAVHVVQTDVCRKWNNLKSYYKYMHQKSSLLDWKNKSKMEFILQWPNSKRSLNNSVKGNIGKLEMADESSFHTEDSFNAHDIQSPQVVIEKEEEEFEPSALVNTALKSSPDTTFPASDSEPSPVPKKRRALNESGLAITNVNSIASNTEQSSSEPNELFHYGNFIVQSIRRLDRDLQIQAKKILTNVILDLETEQVTRDKLQGARPANSF